MGVICIALTVVASYMGSILQAALALFGVISGPILGMFFLGMCVPFANWIVSINAIYIIIYDAKKYLHNT